MRAIKIIGAVAVAAVLGATATMSKPIFFRGATNGVVIGGGEVEAKFQDGQTFITWTDPHVGAAGASFRFRVYRSTSPITEGNYGSATLISSYVPNNSGQLFGGNPDNGGSTFTQLHRQDPSLEMSMLSDLAPALPAFTGLQVYTALATENAYYAVAETTTSDASPTYIGSVGPVAESVGTPRPIKGRDSLSRATPVAYGKIISSTAGKPVVFVAPASDGDGGPPVDSQYGDFWEWWLPASDGWYYDGRQQVQTVLQDTGSAHFPSLSVALQTTYRDTVWNSNWTSAQELSNFGIGMTPNPLVGPANRLYPINLTAANRMLQWVVSHYGADANKLHWTGQSMGAWGGANTGLHLPLASIWVGAPVWRLDQRSTVWWPGSAWPAGAPFSATLGVAPSTLGSVPTDVYMADGTQWGGDGNFADTPAFVAANPGADIPFMAWGVGTGDPFALTDIVDGFRQQITAADAFESANRGYAFCWATSDHGGYNFPRAVIDRDISSAFAGISYRKDMFALNKPYIAFSNSSINDNAGTGTATASHLRDGDFLGCRNAGFIWNVITDTATDFTVTVGNGWMEREPTLIPTTTTVDAISSGFLGQLHVTSTADWLTFGQNYFVLIGNDDDPATQELIRINQNPAGGIINVSARGQFQTVSQSHPAGVTIRQMVTTPTGPNSGPAFFMTADLAIRRAQGGLVPTTCSVTPDGEGPTIYTVGSGLSFNDGVPVLTGVPINASGVTVIACS